MFGNHGLCGLLEEGAHGKSPKCLDGNLGDFGGFCKGLRPSENHIGTVFRRPRMGFGFQLSRAVQVACVLQGAHAVSVGKDQIIESDGFWDGSGFCRIQVSDLRLANPS